MQIIGLTKEKVNDYVDFLTEDIADYIGREFICGFVCVKDGEDEPSAGIIWELGRGDDDLDTKSRILFIKALDEESMKVLLDEYTESAQLAECSGSYFSLPDTLSSVEIDALKKAGFSLEEKEGTVISIPLSKIVNTLIKDGYDRDENIKPLYEAEDRLFDSMIAGLGIDGYYGICEDLAFLPRDFFDNDISCYYEDDEEILAVLLAHKRPSGQIEIDLLHGFDNDPNYVLNIMKQTVLLARDKYEPSTQFLIDRHDERAQVVSKKLFSNIKGDKVYVGSRVEELPEMEEIDTRFYNEEEWDDDFEEY